jgi:hypothetical protein
MVPILSSLLQSPVRIRGDCRRRGCGSCGSRRRVSSSWWLPDVDFRQDAEALGLQGLRSRFPGSAAKSTVYGGVDVVAHCWFLPASVMPSAIPPQASTGNIMTEFGSRRPGDCRTADLAGEFLRDDVVDDAESPGRDEPWNFPAADEGLEHPLSRTASSTPPPSSAKTQVKPAGPDPGASPRSRMSMRPVVRDRRRPWARAFSNRLVMILGDDFPGWVSSSTSG